MRYTAKSTNPLYYAVKVSVYGLVLVLVQAHWVARLPVTALRVDLLLPLMFGVALETPLLVSLFFASMVGFVVDTLSGKFWGFHVGSYVVAACLVHIAVEKMEFHHPIYQMSFVGLCALGQSVALGMFLSLEPTSSIAVASTWTNLVLRAAATMLIAPLIIYPVWNSRQGGR